MKRIADLEMGSWLLRFTGELERFEWDEGNRPKLAKHRVTMDAAESIFRETFVFAGRIVEPAHNEERWLALGRTPAGRSLAIIFYRRGDKLRPISCRAMRKDERRGYEEAVAAKA